MVRRRAAPFRASKRLRRLLETAKVPRMFPCDGVHGIWAPLPEECLEIIDTDRPHQTDTPHVVPAGHTQIESAVASVQLGGTLDQRDKATHVVLFDDAYKFGLITHVDLQLLFKHADYVPSLAHFVAPGPLEVRVKINVLREHGRLPAVTIVPTIFAPFTTNQILRGGALIFLGWELPLGFELEMNAGVYFQRSPLAVMVLASALTHKIAGPVSAFVDIYATGFDVQFGTGLLAPIGRDVQIDCGTYIGINGAVFVATPFVGLSVRR
jgi:hypothetical protein